MRLDQDPITLLVIQEDELVEQNYKNERKLIPIHDNPELNLQNQP